MNDLVSCLRRWIVAAGLVALLAVGIWSQVNPGKPFYYALGSGPVEAFYNSLTPSRQFM